MDPFAARGICPLPPWERGVVRNHHAHGMDHIWWHWSRSHASLLTSRCQYLGSSIGIPNHHHQPDSTDMEQNTVTGTRCPSNVGWKRSEHHWKPLALPSQQKSAMSQWETSSCITAWKTGSEVHELKWSTNWCTRVTTEHDVMCYNSNWRHGSGSYLLLVLSILRWLIVIVQDRDNGIQYSSMVPCPVLAQIAGLLYIHCIIVQVQ